MALLNFQGYGGIVPSTHPRKLPDIAGQEAENLAARTLEFRPQTQDTTAVAASGVTNPVTLYRMARKVGGTFHTDATTGWVVSSVLKNYVRGPIADDATERTYYTFADGSAPPRVTDVNGDDRQLGVPAPTGASVGTVTTVDEFSTEDRGTHIDAIYKYLKNVVPVYFLQPVWRGVDRPGTATPGLMDRDTVPGIDEEESQQLRVFRYTSTAGANNGTLEEIYAGTSGSFDWMFSIGRGFWETADATWPSWAGTTKDHWCIPIHAYGLTYDIAEATLVSTLSNMDKPGAAAGTKLLTSDQVEEIRALVVAESTEQWNAAQPAINALKAKYTQMRTLMDGGTKEAQVEIMKAYYLTSAIASEITSAKATVAKAIFNAAKTLVTTTVFDPPETP